MIPIKTAEDIARMRPTCQLAAKTLSMIQSHIKPGITTNTLNDICHQFILDHGAIPSPLNYRGFPKSICTSINQQVCHGIPSNRTLRGGDIVNVDITTYMDGFHGDTNRTYFVGTPTTRGKKIVQVAQECLMIGIQAAQPGQDLSEVGGAIERYANKNRCSVVREYCGHGIGKAFHEEPAVLHYSSSKRGIEIKPGMVFTIEPMINLGKADIKILPDKWTVVTKDKTLSAQFEHTLLITETGNEILTLLDET